MARAASIEGNGLESIAAEDAWAKELCAQAVRLKKIRPGKKKANSTG
jgi:hypothetical protein